VTDTALRVLAPTPEETLFLRASLPTGPPGRAAFQEWLARVDNPLDALRPPPGWVTALVPALFHATEANAADVPKILKSVMRAAWTHEEARGREFEAACRDVLDATADPAIVLPGVALIATVLHDWPLRHCHDLDLLARADPGRTVHPSGMPVSRHTSLGGEPWFALPVAEAWSRATTAEVAGHEATVLCDADALAHVCILAATQIHPPVPRWAIDAWWIVARGSVDWSVLLDAAPPRLALILSAQLRWLAEELGAPVPGSVLEELRRAARAADRLSVELALFLARRRVGAAGLVRRAGPDRPMALRATLAPSADYLDVWGVTRGEWMRRGAARLVRQPRAWPGAMRSHRESSPGRGPRGAETRAHHPRAR